MDSNWRPAADAEVLKRRAQMMRAIREHFDATETLEMDPPVVQGAPNCDPGIQPMDVSTAWGDRYLVTSPEHPLKRCVAAGLGAVWSLGPAFRDGESGSRHNPEFRMLEWYRPEWSLSQLIDECLDLFAHLTGLDEFTTRMTYRNLMKAFAQVDPFTASDEALIQALPEDLQSVPTSRGETLDLLMTHLVEPKMSKNAWIVVTDFPPEVAAQARIIEDRRGTPVAARFEIYRNGLELANGYHELLDASELRLRMEKESEEGPVDEYLLAALEHGLGECSGVAVGFDRLLMLATEKTDIREVLPFPWDRI